MVVGQQKLKWLESQHKSNTKVNLERFVMKNPRHADHRKLYTDFCSKAMWIPVNARHVKLRKLSKTWVFNLVQGECDPKGSAKDHIRPLIA